MRENRLVLQPEAEADMASAYAWYESKRARLGQRFIAAAEDAFKRILGAPMAPAVTYRGCRQFAIRRFPYVVHYVVKEERVSIVAVLHGHRDPALWQNRVDDLT